MSAPALPLNQIPSLDKFPEAVQLILSRMDALEANIQSIHDAKEKHRYLTVREVMTLFSISKVSIYNWIKSGNLTVYKRGKRTFFKSSEIDAAMVQLKKYKRQ